MKTVTEDLLKELKNVKDINEFLDKNESRFIKENPVSFLKDIAEIKNISIAKIAKESGVGEYVYKVFSNERKPSRDVLLAIAIGTSLSLEETQLLLRISKLAVLDSREKRDSVIIFSIINGKTVFETDDLLEKNGFITIN